MLHPGTYFELGVLKDILIQKNQIRKIVKQLKDFKL